MQFKPIIKDRGNKMVRDLIRAFAQSTGNKVYLREVEQIFEERLKDLTPRESEALQYLIDDLHGLGDLQSKVNQMKNQPWKTW
jgi:hypothetical protein